MSGKSTYHWRIARALSFPVQTKQVSARDLAANPRITYRGENAPGFPMQHRIIYQTSDADSVIDSKAESLHRVDEILSRFDDSDDVPGLHTQVKQLLEFREQRLRKIKNENSDHVSEDDESGEEESDDDSLTGGTHDSPEPTIEEDKESDEDDSDDDDALILAELAKIKKERDLKKKIKEEEEKKYEEPSLSLSSLSGPFLQVDMDASLRPRWDEDTVFRNQDQEQKQKKRFLNDTVRNDFHRRFLEKYIK